MEQFELVLLRRRIGIYPKGQLDVVLLSIDTLFNLLGLGIRSTELVYRLLEGVPPVNLDAACLPATVFMAQIHQRLIESEGDFCPEIGTALVISNDWILTHVQPRMAESDLVLFGEVLERALATEGSPGVAAAVRFIVKEARIGGRGSTLSSKFSSNFTGKFAGARPPVKFVGRLLDRWARIFATEFSNFYFTGLLLDRWRCSKRVKTSIFN